MDNNEIVQEEKRHLEETESILEDIAEKHDREAARLGSERLEYTCYDNDDRGQKRNLFIWQRRELEEAHRYRSYQDSPYFGRIDLEQTDGTSFKRKTYYIGKEGIQQGTELLVIDWRSEVGDCYTSESKKEFCMDNTSYLLLLRRKFDIKRKKLIECVTTYDRNNEIQADVTDSFLLKILEDKRNDRKLTDIIRTISETQNLIIRKPSTESFVVQGCAGSGKTMILLHRLSVLLFNKAISPSNTKIITPNKFFDSYIDDLSIELGLTEIGRYSVEEYYVMLIQGYSSNINISASNVRSEKTLNPNLMKDIYSLDYMDDSISRYHSYWVEVLRALDAARLIKLLSTYGLRCPDTSKHNYDTFLLFYQGISRLIAIIDENKQREEAISKQIKALNESIAVKQEKYQQEMRNLDTIQDQVGNKLEEELRKIQDSIQKSKSKIGELRAHNDELERQRKQELMEEKETQDTVKNLLRNRDCYSNYDLVVLSDDSFSQTIKTVCKEQIAEVKRNEVAYQNVPSYNFSKRGRLVEQVESSKKHFSLAAERFIDSYLRDMQAQIELLHESIKNCNEELDSAKEEIILEENLIHQKQERITFVEEFIIAFQHAAPLDTLNEQAKIVGKQFAEIFAVYEKQKKFCEQALISLNSDRNAREFQKAELQQRPVNQISEEDTAYIYECGKIIKRLQWSGISRNVMFKDLHAKYESYNQKYLKMNFRHKIYLTLLYAFLYFPRSSTTDSFINIDEAQDISVAEYRLLSMVLGDKCVFNLYGDVNQLVYSYKGIDNWEDIPGIKEESVYFLAQNYRNTIEITEFCNNEFKAQITPIGLSGTPVVEMDAKHAVLWILETKKQNPNYRTAILYRYGLKSIQNRLKELLENQDVLWDAVNSKKLSIISVESAKGLEFDAVVVMTDYMSINEKYISYTRALDHLVIVRDTFPAEFSAESSDEEGVEYEESYTEV